MLKNRPLFQKQASVLHLVPSQIKAYAQSKAFPMLGQALLLMASLSILTLTQSANAETFYKWVDKDGSTHYTQTPPRKSSVRSAKKVYIDDQAPATPTASAASIPANGENNNNTTGNSTAVMNANQLAAAANNASVPNNTSNSAQQASSSAAPQQVITPIIAPPANRLIVPTQDQARPAFSEQ